MNYFYVVKPALKRILFVVNPISGGLNKRNLPEQIFNNLDRNIFEAELFYTSLTLNAREITRKAIDEKFDIVIAAGGDGTMNQVAQQLIGTKIIMGILPLGSGNGLARHLNIPLKISDAIAFINKAGYQAIDTIRINDQYSINCIGIGFDAYVAYHFSKLPKRGLQTYISTTLRQFKKFERLKYKLRLDDQVLDGEAALVTFANSSQWGNNFYIASRADIQDGWIDVTVIPKLSYRNFFSLVYRLLTKTLHESSQAKMYKAKKIKLMLEENTPMHIDGEPMLVKDDFEIEIMPGSLKILCDL
jgi:diacylglycerol kinase (ATP)